MRAAAYNNESSTMTLATVRANSQKGSNKLGTQKYTHAIAIVDFRTAGRRLTARIYFFSLSLLFLSSFCKVPSSVLVCSYTSLMHVNCTVREKGN